MMTVRHSKSVNTKATMLCDYNGKVQASFTQCRLINTAAGMRITTLAKTDMCDPDPGILTTSGLKQTTMCHQQTGLTRES